MIFVSVISMKLDVCSMHSQQTVADSKVCQMAKLAAQKIDLGAEKKDICILVELVAGVGMSFESLKIESK